MQRINKITLIILLLLTAFNARANLINDTVTTVATFEGYRAKVYQDSIGVWTIGAGLTTLNGKKVNRYTTATASQLKSGIIKHIKTDLQRLNHIDGFKKLNNNKKRALLSLAYNVGVNAIIKGSISKGIKTGDNNLITSTILKYNRAGGRALHGLKIRRAKEVKIYNTPVHVQNDTVNALLCSVFSQC